jgi:hypothetical protein
MSAVNASISNTLGVTGAADIYGLLTVHNSVSVTGSITVSGNSLISGNQDVYGGFTARGAAAFQGTTTVPVSGAFYLNTAIVAMGGLTGAPGGYTYTYLYKRTTDDRIYAGVTVSSTRKTKRNIKSLRKSDLFDAVKPVTFQYKKALVSAREAERVRFGFIAEDLIDAGLSQVIDFDPDGNPVDVDSRQMVALLWAEVQSLKAEVASLRAV